MGTGMREHWHGGTLTLGSCTVQLHSAVAQGALGIVQGAPAQGAQLHCTGTKRIAQGECRTLVSTETKLEAFSVVQLLVRGCLLGICAGIGLGLVSVLVLWLGLGNAATF